MRKINVFSQLLSLFVYCFATFLNILRDTRNILIMYNVIYIQNINVVGTRIVNTIGKMEIVKGRFFFHFY